jgi:hypothetical protein
MGVFSKDNKIGGTCFIFGVYTWELAAACLPQARLMVARMAAIQ